MSKLSDDQIAVYLGKLPNWRFENDALTKTYQTSNFRSSIRLVEAIADLAETAGHHPDLLIRYRKVTVTLTTHENHGVTGKDFLLAQQIEALPAAQS
jgi:4a-hydroxytetrahydrobiopterin dehydratase